MTRLMIEVEHEPTLRLLQSLIEMRLVNVVEAPKEKVVFDESWIGAISAEAAANMLEQADKMRREWDRNF